MVEATYRTPISQQGEQTTSDGQKWTGKQLRARASLPAPQFLQSSEDLLRLGTAAVVGIEKGVGDDAVSADHVGGGEREPVGGFLSAAFDQFEFFLVAFAGVVVEFENESVLVGDFVVDIAEHFEGQALLLYGFRIGVGQLRRQRDEGGAELLEVVVVLCQRSEGDIAIGGTRRRDTR